MHLQPQIWHVFIKKPPLGSQCKSGHSLSSDANSATRCFTHFIRSKWQERWILQISKQQKAHNFLGMFWNQVTLNASSYTLYIIGLNHSKLPWVKSSQILEYHIVQINIQWALWENVKPLSWKTASSRVSGKSSLFHNDFLQWVQWKKQEDLRLTVV